MPGADTSTLLKSVISLLKPAALHFIHLAVQPIPALSQGKPIISVDMILFIDASGGWEEGCILNPSETVWNIAKL